MTPVGVFNVFSEDGAKLPFSVTKNPLDWPYEVRDEKDVITDHLHTETNYCIIIDASNLKIGVKYRIAFSSGEWNYSDADEHTCCYDTVIGNWVVGIGAYDPNDDEKLDQACEYSEQMGLKSVIMLPQVYDESRFFKYTTDPLDEQNGFSFKLFDYSSSKISFGIAWMKIEKYPAIIYEDAISLWLT